MSPACKHNVNFGKPPTNLVPTDHWLRFSFPTLRRLARTQLSFGVQELNRTAGSSKLRLTPFHGGRWLLNLFHSERPFPTATSVALPVAGPNSERYEVISEAIFRQNRVGRVWSVIWKVHISEDTGSGVSATVAKPRDMTVRNPWYLPLDPATEKSVKYEPPWRSAPWPHKTASGELEQSEKTAIRHLAGTSRSLLLSLYGHPQISQTP